MGRERRKLDLRVCLRLRSLRWFLFVWLCQLSGLAAADPSAAPIIDVYTMGPGEDLFSRFGHAAICVTDAASPAGRCYNYGTADFSTPGPLTWGVVRGNANFWVSVVPLPRMLAIYMLHDRTLYRQRLRIDDETARKLAKTLHLADVREATFYHYHHFNDNCTTRIRDLVDIGTGGALRREAEAKTFPPLRHYVDEGLRGESLLQIASDLVLGRAVDRPTSRWQGMFLPSILRAEIAERLHSPPEMLYERRGPLFSGPPKRSALLLCIAGATLAALAAGLLWLRKNRLARTLVAIPLGLVGLLIAGLVIFSPLPEARYNEALLICWPTDLALPLLPQKLLRSYLALRLGILLLCVVGKLGGLLIQPLLGPLLLCGLPLFVLFGLRRS